MLKKEMEAKNQELQEKVRTITQVKKIGRRYKTQYDELKVEHEKVFVSPLYCSGQPNLRMKVLAFISCFV